MLRRPWGSSDASLLVACLPRKRAFGAWFFAAASTALPCLSTAVLSTRLSRRLAWLPLSLAGAAALAALVHCEGFAGLALPDFVDADAGGDGRDAEPSAIDAGPIDPCSPHVPEPRPSQPGQDVAKATFAIEYLRVAAKSLVAVDESRLCLDPAIDLDGVATGAALPDGGEVGGSCRPLAGKTLDTAGGGDNAATKSIATILGSTPASDSDPNTATRAGQGGALLELDAYNGLDDDSSVSVSLIYAVGLANDAGGLGGAPRWDGTDDWWADPASFNGNVAPLYSATVAYVSGGILVAHFRNAPISLGGSLTKLRADGVVITARIVRNERNQLRRFDQGRIGARIALDTVFRYLGGREATGKSLCDPSGGRNLVLVACCSSADILASGKNDPDVPCDAISYGVGFYATIARREDRPYPVGFDAGTPRECPFPPWPVTCQDAGF